MGDKRVYTTLGAKTNLKQSDYKDDYYEKQEVKAKGYTWKIKSINIDTKNLYHCIRVEKGREIREAFHSIELQKA
jgi:hypothetical protein